MHSDGDVTMQAKNFASAFVLVLLGASTQVLAIPVTFTFDDVAISGTHGNGLGKTGGDSAIAASMNSVLQSVGFGSSSVSVSGALATATYNGENHVNGETLGTSNGGTHHANDPAHPDTFVINDDFGLYGSSADRFSFTFTNFDIYSISFDWEIFPDASCPAGSVCASHPLTNSNYPDIELLADGVSVWSIRASTPVSGDLDPQALGTKPTFNLNGATTLTFVDWPAEIGIDNLVVDGCAVDSPNCDPPKVPEPGVLYLLGACVLAAWGAAWRNRVGARQIASPT
jgi:hypothetical protein